ncbi:nuclear transport factor 2 family protein [Actinobacillus equuli]|uniref:nuclear transport factor 2 family protein n=1 Tax=Actinobacillus equuli TaxID=718 RepID=UPI0024423D71|nr:nuclear transport factor 2 family protein [Actinobacillus equuli]WGE75149.1 nuclear transport factor 2 family protein [Actinobacillus equuli subsp. haemolyticus]WGE77063.1 nuclear transport factor 2 family protein [Actinobacillus equuli subsp. haemolyticus]
MRLTFKHIFLSLFLGIALSITADLPVISNVEAKQEQQEKVIEVYEELNNALINPNFAKLQSLLADDFELVTSKNDTMTKQEWIKNIQKGGMKYGAIQESKIKSKGYDELLVTARVFGDMWDQTGSWNVKFDIDTKQNGDKVQITKIIVTPVKA